MTVLTSLCSKKKDKHIFTTEESQCMTSDETYITPYHPTNVGRRIAVGVVLCLSLAINLILVCYLLLRGNQTSTNIAGPIANQLKADIPIDSVCLSCTSLGIPRSSETELYTHLAVYEFNEDRLCCLNNVVGLRNLLILFSSRFQLKSLNDSTVPGILNDVRTYGVHQYIDSVTLKKTPPVLSWTTDYGYGAAYKPPGTEVTDGRIHIKEPGLYHLYSFLTYKTKHPSPTPQTIVHTINRSNKNLPELGSVVLLINKKTLPSESERFDNSFLFATLRLRKGDEIFVKISNLSYIYKYAPSNFFGLYQTRES